ncbi:hypothetical protein [Pseudomonas sp. 10-1B]|uniref:hypothetical protein n=1 Tax=Pseudomonas sp. 10-1B TaxID=1546029 RepID=UPI00128CD978|nr:hypothetical protein [Pseudomonas sp. 10-1B]
MRKPQLLADRASNTDLIDTTKPTPPECDLSAISTGIISIEGADDTDPDRVYLSEHFHFEPGPTVDVRGVKRTSINVYETMEMGFYRNWLSDGISALGSEVARSLSNSCSNSVGAPSSGMIGYLPPIGRFQIGVTKRACAIVELPCGMPETTCRGGRLWPPEAPVCETRAKMCRIEQSTDMFSTSALMDFQVQVKLSGTPPTQEISFERNIVRNDVDSSSGEVFRLFNDLRLAEAFQVSLGNLERLMKNIINLQAKALQTGGAGFKIPTADYIYVPKATTVSWGNPTNIPLGAAPYSIIIKREMSLATPLACRLISCIQQSKKAGKLLINSCTI